MVNAAKAKDQKRNQELASAELTQVSDEINDLQGWSRNPFISAAEPMKMISRSVIKEPLIVDQMNQEEQTIPAIVIEKDELFLKDDIFYKNYLSAEYYQFNKIMDLDGISVKILFGTWCHDSQREIPKLLKMAAYIFIYV